MKESALEALFVVGFFAKLCGPAAQTLAGRPVVMQKNSYSKAEVITAGRKLPERGLLCHECGATIPIFEDLSQADEKRVRESIQQSGPFMAIQELRTATGCSLEWAKLWVQHEGRPKPAETIPCPYCGMPLRTTRAKQCRFCWRDWHDE